MSFRTHISLILLLFIGFGFNSLAQDPEPPVIRFVSVDTLTGNVIINWETGSGSAVESFVVYQGREGSDPIVADPIDTLDASVTSYMHSSSAAGTRSVSYTVASIFAEETSPLAAYHHTIYTTIKYDSCQNSLIIGWTPYLGWNNNLIAYNVYIKAGSDEWIKIPSLSSTSASYVFTDAIPYTDYCVFIEAENRNFLTSTSNKVCLTTNRASPPSYINADFATVTKIKPSNFHFRLTQFPRFTISDYFNGITENKIVDLVSEFNNVTSASINYTTRYFHKKGKKLLSAGCSGSMP